MRGRAGRSFFVAICVGLGLLLAACSSPDVSSGSSSTTTTLPGQKELVSDGTVTVAVPSLPTNFNPSTPEGDNRITQMVMEQVWPQPFITDPTFNIETSDLLTSAEVEGISPFTVVYVINPHAVWSDGSPITASDFIYSWRENLLRSSSLADSGLVAGYRDIAAVTGSDGGRVVTVTFRQAFSEWQSLFADLVPARIGQRYGWVNAFAGFSPSHILSGGPFEVTSYTKGRSLELSRNPRFWGTPAHVAHIRFLVASSAREVVSGVESGKFSLGTVDLSLDPPGTIDEGLVSDASQSGATTPHPPGPVAWSGFAGDEIWQLCFNLENPVTGHLVVREAIEHSLERSEIVADSVDLVDPRIPAALARLALAGESSNPNVPGTAPIIEEAPSLYAPTVATREFALAGYRRDSAGVLRDVQTGAPLRLRLVEPSGDWAVDHAGLVIEGELRAAGVSVSLSRQRLDEMLAVSLPAGTFQLALAPFDVSASAVEMAPYYTAPVRGSAGARSAARGYESWETPTAPETEPGAVAAGSVTRDVIGLNDSAVTRDLAAALVDLNPPKSLADLQRADAEMWTDVATVPLFQPALALVRSVRLNNVSESPTWAGIMWDAEDWAVLKNAAAPTSTTSAALAPPEQGSARVRSPG